MVPVDHSLLFAAALQRHGVPYDLHIYQHGDHGTGRMGTGHPWMRDLLFGALESLQDIQAIIRVHPNDNPLDYEIALQYHPELRYRVRISRQHDVASVLKACKLEALIAGAYIIAVKPADEIGWIVPPYLEDYLAKVPYLCAGKPEDFSKAWKEINRPENKGHLDGVREDIIQRYAFAKDGKNTERVMQIIYYQLKHHRQLSV
jgi:hypothetical protein